MSPRPAPAPTSATASTPDDEALRQALAQALQQARAPAERSHALQHRVLADWQTQAQAQAQAAQLAQQPARQPLAAAPAFQGAGPGRPSPLHLPGGLAPLRRGLAGGLLVLGLAAAAAWWLRPDPVLSELLQPDVLSQMGLGEF